MLRQYRPQRCRYTLVGSVWRPVGVIPIGTIVWLASGKAIVEAWLPREIAAWRFADGDWQPAYVANGMFLAQCRTLHDSRRRIVADRVLLAAFDAGRSLEPHAPDIRRQRTRLPVVPRAA